MYFFEFFLSKSATKVVAECGFLLHKIVLWTHSKQFLQNTTLRLHASAQWPSAKQLKQRLSCLKRARLSFFDLYFLHSLTLCFPVHRRQPLLVFSLLGPVVEVRVFLNGLGPWPFPPPDFFIVVSYKTITFGILFFQQSTRVSQFRLPTS